MCACACMCVCVKERENTEYREIIERIERIETK